MKRLIATIIVILVATGPVFSQKKDTYRVRTVVIDAGHGGAKPGAQGKRAQEKTITLAVAMKFGKLLEDNYPDMKVIYTRTTDADISLAERAHIANRNKADLFISIHANSHPTSTPTGVETFVMGLSESRANLEVAKKENADILLEADYKNNSDYQGFDPNAPETYVMLTMFQNAFIDKSLNLAQAIQNQYKQNLKTVNRGVKQAELYVLYKTTCPSVLTEIGFISNPAEETFMLSDEGQAKIAVCLFNAFMTYKATEEGTDRIADPVINITGWKETKQETKPEAPSVAKTGEQISAKDEGQPPTVAKENVQPVDHTVDSQPMAQATPQVVETEETPAKEVAEMPVPSQPKPVVSKPTPSAQLPEKPTAAQPTAPKAQSPVEDTAPAAKPTTTKPVQQAVLYRVQVCSSTRELKVGDPDLHGIKDIHSMRNGKYYVYTAGDYNTEQEARQRCKQIQSSTPFHDAFVIAIHHGERITLERARQIEKQNQQK